MSELDIIKEKLKDEYCYINCDNECPLLVYVGVDENCAKYRKDWLDSIIAKAREGVDNERWNCARQDSKDTMFF